MKIYLSGAPGSENGRKKYPIPHRLLSFYNILNQMWGDSYVLCWIALHNAKRAAQKAAVASKAGDPSANKKQKLAEKLARAVMKLSNPVPEGRESMSKIDLSKWMASAKRQMATKVHSHLD